MHLATNKTIATFSPEGVATSHAHPEPNAVSAFVTNSLRKLSKLPKSLSIAAASFPLGFPTSRKIL
jgi:hypothetical protein